MIAVSFRAKLDTSGSKQSTAASCHVESRGATRLSGGIWSGAHTLSLGSTGGRALFSKRIDLLDVPFLAAYGAESNLPARKVSTRCRGAGAEAIGGTRREGEDAVAKGAETCVLGAGRLVHLALVLARRASARQDARLPALTDRRAQHARSPALQSAPARRPGGNLQRGGIEIAVEREGVRS